MFVYKNLQLIHEEVQKFDLSFRDDFEICDRVPTSDATTTTDRKLKRLVDENQSCIISAYDDFDDFSIIPLREILIKAGLSSDLSAGQVSKRRKTVMFEKSNSKGKDDEISTRICSLGDVLRSFSKAPDASTTKELFQLEHGQ